MFVSLVQVCVVYVVKKQYKDDAGICNKYMCKYNKLRYEFRTVIECFTDSVFVYLYCSYTYLNLFRPKISSTQKGRDASAQQ